MDRRQIVGAMPGAVTRFGPAQRNGLARGDQTGSVRMFTPAAWISTLAWPTIVTRSPATDAAGLAGVTGTSRGQRAAAPAIFQRNSARSPRSVED